jgi:hypothetical protein
LIHKPENGKPAKREGVFQDNVFWDVDRGVTCQKSMQKLGYSTSNETQKFQLLNAWVEEIIGSGNGEAFLSEPHPIFKIEGAPEFHPFFVTKRASGFPCLHKWIRTQDRFERLCWLFDSSGAIMKRFKEREIWFATNSDCTEITRGPFWEIKIPYTGEASYTGPK